MAQANFMQSHRDVERLWARYPISATVAQNINIHNSHCRNAELFRDSNQYPRMICLFCAPATSDIEDIRHFPPFIQAVIDFRVEGPIDYRTQWHRSLRSVSERRAEMTFTPKEGASNNFGKGTADRSTIFPLWIAV